MHPFTTLPVLEGHVGIHWFEQNAYAFKDSQGRITLVDPYFPHDRPAERFIRPTPPVDEATLPTTYVVFTHAHGDHTNSETVARIHAAWPYARYIGPWESIAQILLETDVQAEQTRVLAAGDVSTQEGLNVYAVYAKPVEGDPAAGIAPPTVTHLSVILEIEGLRLYVTGDTINTIADHADLVGAVAAFKPDIGFLTTHPTEGEFPFFDGSVALAQKVGLKTAVPSHYQCFAKRTYDPQAWAACFPADGLETLIIPWNSAVVYP